jgi:hypothetical protein
MTPRAASITIVAEAFFEACETRKGWEVCSAYCTPNATFSAQAEPLLDIKTLSQYADWMKGITKVLPDASYEVRSFATDGEPNNGRRSPPPRWPGGAARGRARGDLRTRSRPYRARYAPSPADYALVGCTTWNR